MKKIYIILMSLCGVYGFSQEANTTTLKKANASFAQNSFAKAIIGYEEVDLSTVEDKRKLAHSYWKTNALSKAEILFSKIVEMEGHTADDVYNYAAVLRENKKYDTADSWMSKFNTLNAYDSRGQAYISEKGAFKELSKDKGQFVLNNLDINSEQQDFGATYYKDEIVFASSREGVKSIYRRWNWNQLPFLDTYVANNDGDQLSNPVHFSKKVNKKFHEGPVAFNQAGDKMIFTRNNYKEKAIDKIVRLKMFSSNYQDGKWSKPQALPFNSSDYSCGQASISANGKWLYFASDMPGGIGGVDIYKAAINQDGSYGEAINMGAQINTEGNEMFPFIHSSNEMLFFSSTGKVGLGGLDVFVAQIKPDNSIGKVMNVGAPINSNRDDFSFVLNVNQKSGYLSSNRDGGKGDDDIYGVKLLKPFTFGKTVKGIAKDKEGAVLAGVNVDLLDDKGNLIQTVITDENGTFEFMVDADQKFNLTGNKEKYFTGKRKVNSNIEKDVILANLELEKDPGLSLYALITDSETKAPIEDVKITITDNITGLSEIVNTPETGDYFKPLADKKLNDRGSYNLILEKEGYLTKTVTYNTVFDHEGKYEVHTALDLSLEAISVGGDLSKIIDIEPIYFDLGKSKIRPDAAIELDKIVKVMNENPQMVIELGSHTDSRGSTKSNESLSDRRAKASAAYIKERISNPERINGKGYGESTPNTIDLSNEGGTSKQILEEEFINGFKTSDRKMYDNYHQMNRRTEFIIIKM